MTIEEKIPHVKKCLAQLAHLSGFPETTDSFGAIVTAIAKIVHCRPILDLVNETCRRHGVEGATAEALDAKYGEGYSAMTDLEWLFSEVIEGAERFPAPALFRRLHGGRFIAADKKLPNPIFDTGRRSESDNG